jgi:RNA polymerase sigma factor (sigma-70 family)
MRKKRELSAAINKAARTYPIVDRHDFEDAFLQKLKYATKNYNPEKGVTFDVYMKLAFTKVAVDVYRRKCLTTKRDADGRLIPKEEFSKTVSLDKVGEIASTEDLEAEETFKEILKIADEEDTEIIHLKLEGKSLSEIGDIIGKNKVYVHRRIKSLQKRFYENKKAN